MSWVHLHWHVFGHVCVCVCVMVHACLCRMLLSCIGIGLWQSRSKGQSRCAATCFVVYTRDIVTVWMTDTDGDESSEDYPTYEEACTARDELRAQFPSAAIAIG